MEADLDHDGKISFEEFTKMVENTDVSNSMTVGRFSLPVHRTQLTQSRSILSRPERTRLMKRNGAMKGICAEHD